jgi:antitoxin component of RelBE/YafQ-DinJ toxin-antitoxin module
MADNKKVRSFTRVDDELWDRAMAKARSEGTTLSEVVRDLLADYADDRPLEDDLRRAIKRLNAIHKRLKLAGGGDGDE